MDGYILKFFRGIFLRYKRVSVDTRFRIFNKFQKIDSEHFEKI